MNFWLLLHPSLTSLGGCVGVSEEGRSVSSPLSLCWSGGGGGAPGFFVFWLQYRGYFLSVSVLALSFDQLFSFFSFFSVPIEVSGLTASPASNLGYMRQKEDPGESPPCRSSGFEAPIWSAFFSPPLGLMFVLYYVMPKVCSRT